MESVFLLALPYTCSNTSRVKVSGIIIANNKNDIRYSIQIADGNCSKIEKVLSNSMEPVNDAVNYIGTSESNYPLLLSIPADYQKLKLQMTISTHEAEDLQRKTLVILKTTGNDDDTGALREYLNLNTYETKAREVSKIAYSKMLANASQIHDIIINDSFEAKGYSGSRLNVSLWEHDLDTGLYSAMISFHLWVEKNPDPIASPIDKAALLHKTDVQSLSKFTLLEFRKTFSFNLDDGPEFRKSLEKYEKDLPKFKRAMSLLCDEVRGMESSFKRLASSRHKIIELLETLINSQFSPLLKRLSVAKGFLKTFLLIFDPMEKNMAFILREVLNVSALSKMTSYCLTIIANEGSDLSSTKKAFEKNSKEFYDWLNKYLSNERDRPQLKLLLKRKTFELSKFDYLNSLNLASNNQYFNHFIECLLKFSGMSVEKQTLNFDDFKSKRGTTLISNDDSIYLTTLSRFNSEKLQLRQKIEACRTNEELTNITRLQSIHPYLTGLNPSDKAVDLAMSSGKLDLLFASAEKGSSYAMNATLQERSPIDDQNSEISGILFALGGKGKPGWHKEWVVLKDGQLMEFSDWRKGRLPINKPIDVALASVKPTNHDKRQYCFEIITSLGNKHVFQAMSEDDRHQWIKALYNAGQVTSRLIQKKVQKLTVDSKLHLELPLASKAAHQTRLGSPVSIISNNISKNHESKDFLTVVRSIEGSNNLICADCGSRESVEWVSITFLVAICIQCSSCHRNMGSHISKVRSLKLDNFENETRILLGYINNSAVNSYLEYSVGKKVSPDAADGDRLAYVKEKYVLKAFLKPLPNLSNFLVKAVQNISISDVIMALNSGADSNSRIQMGSTGSSTEPITITLFEYSLRKLVEVEKDGKTEEYFVISELLLLNGCKIEQIEVLHSDLNLSDEAKAYWKEKCLRAQGIL